MKWIFCFCINQDLSLNTTPDKKIKSRSEREGSVVVATTTSSPKQPLLDNSDEEEDEDTQHVARHESEWIKFSDRFYSGEIHELIILKNPDLIIF